MTEVGYVMRKLSGGSLVSLLVVFSGVKANDQAAVMEQVIVLFPESIARAAEIDAKGQKLVCHLMKRD